MRSTRLGISLSLAKQQCICAKQFIRARTLPKYYAKLNTLKSANSKHTIRISVLSSTPAQKIQVKLSISESTSSTNSVQDLLSYILQPVSSNMQCKTRYWKARQLTTHIAKFGTLETASSSNDYADMSSLDHSSLKSTSQEEFFRACQLEKHRT